MPNEQIAIEVSIVVDSTTARVPTPQWFPGEGVRDDILYGAFHVGRSIMSGRAIVAGAIGARNVYIDYPPVPRYALQNEVEALYERIARLEAAALVEPEALRDITKEQATEEIRTLFSEGEIIYMSDVAERLNLPDELVVEICLELAADGELNRRDNP
ncbi:MAG: hypothetical protein IID00_03785 [Chloroflexi bacterium]|nr:hypothetical protein [Chloroflexota bacterium]